MPRATLSEQALEQTRDELAQLGLAVYREGGLEAISFRRLAEHAGISHTMPYRYFDGKEALLARMRVAALRHFTAVVVESAGRGENPLARARGFVLGYMDFARQYTDEYRLIFASEQPRLEKHPEVLAARQQVFEVAVGLMEDCVSSGALAGDPRVLAHTVWVGIHGLMTLHAAGQLVHGLSLEALIEPLLEKLLGSAL